MKRALQLIPLMMDSLKRKLKGFHVNTSSYMTQNATRQFSWGLRYVMLVAANVALSL